MTDPQPDSDAIERTEFEQFDELTRKLLRAPKEELDKAVVADNAAKKKRAS